MWVSFQTVIQIDNGPIPELNVDFLGIFASDNVPHILEHVEPSHVDILHHAFASHVMDFLRMRVFEPALALFIQ